MNHPGEMSFEWFFELLEAVGGLYGKTIGTTQAAMYFRILSAYPMESVQAAFDAHAKCPERGRFMPMPADLLAKLEAAQENDGRPIPEEAWSIAIRAMNEADTVVWTEEIAQAWSEVGRGLMEAGDKFNASRGFISRYQQLVKEARKGGIKPRWVVSQGHDKDLRHLALETAYKAGLIARETVRQMLPRHNQETGPIVAAIAGKTVALIGDGRNTEKSDAVAEIQDAGKRFREMAESLRKSASESGHVIKPTIEHNVRIVNQAIEAGVLKSVREIDGWMTRARNREDLNELQAKIIGVMANG